MEWLFINGSYVKAYQHSSGANPHEKGISKSRGGNTTKIHFAVDAHGKPIYFIITDGTTHDVKIAPQLIDDLDLSQVVKVCADKGYDSEDLRQQIESLNTSASVPRRKNSKQDNDNMDWHLYKIRHLVKNAFCTIKPYRAVSTHYDKLKQIYENIVVL